MSVGLGRIRANLVGTNWLDESEPGHSVTARVVDEVSSILAGCCGLPLALGAEDCTDGMGLRKMELLRIPVRN